MSACEVRRSRSRGVGARLQHLKPLVRSRELRSVRSRTLLILLVTLRTERMKPLADACKSPLLAIALVLGLEAA